MYNDAAAAVLRVTTAITVCAVVRLLLTETDELIAVVTAIAVCTGMSFVVVAFFSVFCSNGCIFSCGGGRGQSFHKDFPAKPSTKST